eukprot:2533822-Amphidinium_carterae.1
MPVQCCDGVGSDTGETVLSSRAGESVGLEKNVSGRQWRKNIAAAFEIGVTQHTYHTPPKSCTFGTIHRP